MFMNLDHDESAPAKPAVDDDFVPPAQEHGPLLVPSFAHKTAVQVKGIQTVLNG